jgi:hypothetical protein
MNLTVLDSTCQNADLFKPALLERIVSFSVELIMMNVQTVAVGVIKATTPKEAAGVTTKAAQKVCTIPGILILRFLTEVTLLECYFNFAPSTMPFFIKQFSLQLWIVAVL